MRHFLSLTALSVAALVLSACSSDPSEGQAMNGSAIDAADATNGAMDAPMPEKAVQTGKTAAPVAVPPGAASVPAPSDNVLTLEGLGKLRIGQPVPKDSSWAARGAQASDSCRTVSSPQYPGVYAIVEKGAVRRITIGQRSTVKLAEGIGPGSTEKEVKSAIPGFRESPHKYLEAPAKYLTAPNVDSGDPALRFEIGVNGKVSIMHVGTMPVLGYVEGCG